MVCDYIENCVWEAAQKSAPCLFVDAGMLQGISLNLGECGVDTEKKVIAEPDLFILIPLRCQANVLFRLWSNQQ